MRGSSGLARALHPAPCIREAARGPGVGHPARGERERARRSVRIALQTRACGIHHSAGRATHKHDEASEDEDVQALAPLAEDGDKHNHNRRRGEGQEEEEALARMRHGQARRVGAAGAAAVRVAQPQRRG